MENKEYKLGSASSQKEAGPPAPGAGVTEKSKDFWGTWSKLIHYCKKYVAVAVIALICAVIGTILTLIGPDKLSELTDLITEGIMTGIDMDSVARIGFTLVMFCKRLIFSR